MTTSGARGGASGPSPLPTLVLAALGVVYGDIGTSPLYALRECFRGPHAVEPTAANVLGVLSLTTWSLILVVSVKYLVLILRADNRGEGASSRSWPWRCLRPRRAGAPTAFFSSGSSAPRSSTETG